MTRNLAHAVTSPTPTPPPTQAERPLAELGPALRATLVTLVLTGLAYPLAMTGLSQLLFPRQAGGSLAADGSGAVVGSTLLAQGFARPGYLQPRPSAAGKGYDPTSSSGSNLGPTSQKLRDGAAAALEAVRKANPEAPDPVPVELITASGSGLDPHLSPGAARWQAPRIARARGVSVERVLGLMDEYTEGRDLGLLGEPRVNVLAVNLALDQRFGAPRSDEAHR